MSNVNTKDSGFLAYTYMKTISPNMLILGDSSSEKTDMIKELVEAALKDEARIVLSSPTKMFISKYRDDWRVFTVSKLDELVTKLNGITLRIELIDTLCSDLGVDSIPADGKIKAENVVTVDGYPVDQRVVDIYSSTNLGEEEELDDIDVKSYIGSHIVIVDKNSGRRKRLLVTSDNISVDNEIYLEPTLIVLDEIALYSNEFENEDVVRDYERAIKKLLVLGSKYNIHIAMATTSSSCAFDNLIHTRCRFSRDRETAECRYQIDTE